VSRRPEPPQEVADGVHHVPGSDTNWMLITEGADVTLVDAGYPADVPHVLRSLELIGRSPADVAAVVITHGHADHVGAAARLRQEHGARVIAHDAEEPNVTGVRTERISELDIALRSWRPKMLRFAVHVLRARALAAEHVEDVETFRTDEPLDVPGRPIPVFTPGHTSGHCAFHLPERGVLISGDALITRDPISRETGPRLIDRLFNVDHARARASLEALRPCEAELILPGHGAPYHGTPDDAVRIALERADG
jgi:glyoxylase-like metal-dependent hydrolase (beta-lactamase superfamily II)